VEGNREELNSIKGGLSVQLEDSIVVSADFLEKFVVGEEVFVVGGNHFFDLVGPIAGFFLEAASEDVEHHVNRDRRTRRGSEKSRKRTVLRRNNFRPKFQLSTKRRGLEI
jgi:hypothetical protein